LQSHYNIKQNDWTHSCTLPQLNYSRSEHSDSRLVEFSSRFQWKHKDNCKRKQPVVMVNICWAHGQQLAEGQTAIVIVTLGNNQSPREPLRVASSSHSTLCWLTHSPWSGGIKQQ